MTTQTAEKSGKEMGLIKHLSQRNTQLGWKTTECELAISAALRMLTIYAPEDAIFEYAWNIRLFRKTWGLTHIDDYTNKRGITFKAHFNPNNKFICKVKEEGEEPKEVLYNERVSWRTHTWDSVEQAFLPKKLAEQTAEPTTAEPVKKKAKKIIRKKSN
jgi:hypothetical protein